VRRTAPQPLDAGTLQELKRAFALHQQGQLGSAIEVYLGVLGRRPDCFDALHLLGVASAAGGDTAAGARYVRRAIEADPSQAMAHYSLASIVGPTGATEEALASLARAVELAPAHVDAWFLQGNLLMGRQRCAEAIESYGRVLALQPGNAAAHSNQSAALRRFDEAVAAADRAIALNPDYDKDWNNKGLALLDSGQPVPAIESFSRAVSINDRYPEVLHNLAAALLQVDRYSQARDALERLCAIAPDFPHALGQRLSAALNYCDWQCYDEAVATVVERVGAGEHADLPMSFLSICDDPRLQLQCARTYCEAHFPARQAGAASQRADRVRVAYLSGDFGEHAVSYLLAGVWEQHDPTCVETVALSWGRAGDGALRERVERAFTRFIDVTRMTDAGIVQLMRELKVDIAVDLTGHTRGQRTGIFALRSAPVQVNFLGFPASTGASYMDYLIADRYVVPASARDDYAERIVWLPRSFHPFDDARTVIAPAGARSDHGLPDKAVVFASFNSNSKLTPACFSVWCRLLAAVPGSVLWLLATTENAQHNLRREARARGVDPDRLIFAGRVPYESYLARFVHADLFLDSIPFNGGTTVNDALRCGVPVVTCSGNSFSARMAGSVLCALGLPELVTTTVAEYEAVVAAVARDRDRLAALRARLAVLRREHEFFRSASYCRGLERAYLAMRERCVGGLAPAHLAVV